MAMTIGLAQVKEVTNELEVALKAFTDNYRKLEGDINALVGSQFDGPAARAFKTSFEGAPTEAFNEVKRITDRLYQFMGEEAIQTEKSLNNMYDINAR